MANVLPTRPRFAVSRRSFAVVASQYNAEYVRSLVANFKTELDAVSPGSAVTVLETPGAFEIPLLVQEAADTGTFDAIVAFGVIINGVTRHADMIGRAVTDALLRISLQKRIPVIHEVLLVDDEQQARERCMEQRINRGIEAARTATMAVQLLNQARGR